MAGWHHQLDGCEFEWTPGVGDGQGGLACWDSWGPKESDTTEWLNWTELNTYIVHFTVAHKQLLSEGIKEATLDFLYAAGSVLGTEFTDVLQDPFSEDPYFLWENKKATMYVKFKCNNLSMCGDL